MAARVSAVTQVSHRSSGGRTYYDKKVAEGKTAKEALRALKRQVSDAIYKHLKADAARAAGSIQGPGGHQGNDSVASAASSHPEHRLFGQATPGPAPTLRSRPHLRKKATSRASKRPPEPLGAKRSRYGWQWASGPLLWRGGGAYWS